MGVTLWEVRYPDGILTLSALRPKFGLKIKNILNTILSPFSTHTHISQLVLKKKNIHLPTHRPLKERNQDRSGWKLTKEMD